MVAAVFPLTVPPPISDAAVTSDGLELLAPPTTDDPAPFDRLMRGMLTLFATVTTALVPEAELFAVLAAELALLAALITAAWLAATSTGCCGGALAVWGNGWEDDPPVASADCRGEIIRGAINGQSDFNIFCDFVMEAQYNEFPAWTFFVSVESWN